MSHPGPDSPDPRIPLVLGVTGHRDLRRQDIPRLEASVREILLDLEKRYPHTPLLLLSPLAEGADRLVARVALDQGARLMVPMPMPRGDYEEDFVAEGSVDEFRGLLEEAEATIEMPIIHGAEAAVGRQGSEERDRQYALVGAYVARHSQILIALWDGIEPEAVGGTAQIVHFARTGYFAHGSALQDAFEKVPEPFGPTRHALDRPETATVLHLVTPRQKGTKPSGAFEIRRLAPLHDRDESVGGDDEAWDEIYFRGEEAIRDRQESFNLDVRRLADKLGTDIRQSARYLLPEGMAELPASLRDLRHRYAVADVLALRFQRYTRRVTVLLAAVVFLAACFLAHHSNLSPGWEPWSLATYLLLLALAHVLYLVFTRKLDCQNRYQDYRALAEGIRVQFFWYLAGLELSAAEHYMRWQKSELSWIRRAARAWALPIHALLCRETLEPMLTVVRPRWVEDQLVYFRKSFPAKRGFLLALRFATYTFLLASLSLAAYEVARRDSGGFFGALVVTAAALVFAQTCGAVAELRRQLAPPGAAQALAWKGIRRGTLVALLSTALLWEGLALSYRWLGKREGWLVTDVEPWRITAIVLTAVLAALVGWYTHTLAVADEARQYRRMYQIFADGERALSQLGPLDALNDKDRTRALDILKTLGEEALAENGEWLLMHRERPLEMPHA